MNDREGATMSSLTTDDDVWKRDIAEIEAKVAELQRSQQQENVEGFISLFTPQARRRRVEDRCGAEHTRQGRVNPWH